MIHLIPVAFAVSALIFSALSNAQDKAVTSVPAYQGWQHSGALTILTTPDGANLPAGAAVEANLSKSGYLLLGWSTLNKLVEIKREVMDRKRPTPAGK